MKLMTLRNRINWGFTLGFLLSIVSLAHLPSRFLVGAFDRNAGPQFIALLCAGVVALGAFATRRDFAFGKSTAAVIGFLIFTVTISLVLSDSFLISFLGDTGRYAGYASLIALIALGLFASSLDDQDFRDLLLGSAIGLVLVTLLGALQALNIISLPTGGGVGSTLGNLDFLSAWIGTTVILIALLIRELRASHLFTAGYLLLSVFVLWKIEAKQGFLDLLLIVVAIAIYLLLKGVGVRATSATALKAVATFLILLWSEAIYLIPMAKLPLPGVSNDPQVSIRADFWFSAAQMFSHHIGFGVGPDNYGSYYEKYRSLHSVKTTEFVLSNDAHSSMMQTLGTVGIFATIAFLALLLLVLYAGIDLYMETRNKRYPLLLLAFFIFYTNAMISPITLPNKAIFWALGGYLLGEHARRNLAPAFRATRMRVASISLILIAVLIFAASIFIPSFSTLNSAIARENSGGSAQYSATGNLPCIVFAGTQLQLVARSQGDVEAAAREILASHPRCLDALSLLAQSEMRRKNYAVARPYIYQLLDVAPARQSVVHLAAIYAMAANDQELKNLLTAQGLKLGILTESQLK